MSTPKLLKVAFTLFPVDDPVRARAFYEQTLGLAPGMTSSSNAWTEHDLPGGGCLALFKHPIASQAMKPGGAIAFEVDDLDAWQVHLADAGVVVRGDVVRGPRCRMLNILDTEGNAITLHALDRDHAH